MKLPQSVPPPAMLVCRGVTVHAHTHPVSTVLCLPVVNALPLVGDGNTPVWGGQAGHPER